MKNKLFAYLLLCVFIFAVLLEKIPIYSNSSLSVREMSNIQGGDFCSDELRQATVALTLVGAFTGGWAGFFLFGMTLWAVDCETSPPGSGSQGGYTNPCPNGGSPEEVGACTQMGGHSTGTPIGNYSSNMTCCQD